MGNRAVIDFGHNLGVYLHWNGGPESVEAFCKAAKQLGIHDPMQDPTYAAARFCQMVGNFFGGTYSLGVGSLQQLDCDNGDNGTYVLGPGWTIKKRKYVVDLRSVDPVEVQRITTAVLATNTEIFDKEGA